MVKPGETIGERYRLIAMRGRGGMGEVWEADSGSGQHVAIKLMHQHLVEDPELVERFRREYQTGSSLEHPSLVRMFDSGEHNGLPYIVMELVPGKSLRRLVDKGAPYFQSWEAAEVGRQLASALTVLHAARIVHRDIKSSNIMLDRDLRAKLIDFGIVRMSGRSSLTPTDAMMGTAEFTAPETYFNRRQESGADIYSLGIVMYEMVVGRPPFRGDRYADVLRMHAELPPPRISVQEPRVHPQLDNLVHAMLQKQPNKRPTSAQVEAGCLSVIAMAGPNAEPQLRHAPPPRPRPQHAAPAPPPPPQSASTRARPSPWIFLAAAGAGSAAVVLAALVAGGV